MKKIMMMIMMVAVMLTTSVEAYSIQITDRNENKTGFKKATMRSIKENESVKHEKVSDEMSALIIENAEFDVHDLEENYTLEEMKDVAQQYARTGATVASIQDFKYLVCNFKNENSHVIYFNDHERKKLFVLRYNGDMTHKLSVSLWFLMGSELDSYEQTEILKTVLKPVRY